MKNYFWFRLNLIIAVITLMSGCGFQLRGIEQHNLAGVKISLEFASPQLELESKLHKALNSVGGKIVEQQSNADLLLVVTYFELRRQGASRDATGRANEILLRAKLDYQLAHQTESMAKSPIKTLRVSRSYYEDYRNPVSEQNLQRQTKQAVYAELIRQLIDQVQWHHQKLKQQAN